MNSGQKPLGVSLIYRTEQGGGLYLSQCPGKNLPRGRDGKPYSRDLATDLRHFQSCGVSTVVCLLNQYELRTLGVDLRQYQEMCGSMGLTLLEHSMVEMAAPDNLRAFDSQVVTRIAEGMAAGQSFLVHCRGGIGRSGLVAACVLLKLAVVSGPKAAISYTRAHRDPRCVESRKQEDFISLYYRETVAR